MNRKKSTTEVTRITIDEKLSENIFRFLICKLKEGYERFSDRVEQWTDEKEKIVTPQNYHRILKIMKRYAPKWEDLAEGQVYLSGNFKIIGDPKNPDYFEVNYDNEDFIRIDEFPSIKDGLKHLYSDILKRSAI